jgi:hypothetical protein
LVSKWAKVRVIDELAASAELEHATRWLVLVRPKSSSRTSVPAWLSAALGRKIVVVSACGVLRRSSLVANGGSITIWNSSLLSLRVAITTNADQLLLSSLHVAGGNVANLEDQFQRSRRRVNFKKAGVMLNV